MKSAMIVGADLDPDFHFSLAFEDYFESLDKDCQGAGGQSLFIVRCQGLFSNWWLKPAMKFVAKACLQSEAKAEFMWPKPVQELGPKPLQLVAKTCSRLVVQTLFQSLVKSYLRVAVPGLFKSPCPKPVFSHWLKPSICGQSLFRSSWLRLVQYFLSKAYFQSVAKAELMSPMPVQELVPITCLGVSGKSLFRKWWPTPDFSHWPKLSLFGHSPFRRCWLRLSGQSLFSVSGQSQV